MIKQWRCSTSWFILWHNLLTRSVRFCHKLLLCEAYWCQRICKSTEWIDHTFITNYRMNLSHFYHWLGHSSFKFVCMHTGTWWSISVRAHGHVLMSSTALTLRCCRWWPSRSPPSTKLNSRGWVLDTASVTPLVSLTGVTLIWVDPFFFLWVHLIDFARYTNYAKFINYAVNISIEKRLTLMKHHPICATIGRIVIAQGLSWLCCWTCCEELTPGYRTDGLLLGD